MYKYRILLLLLFNIILISCVNNSKAKLENTYYSLFLEEENFPENIFSISNESETTILNNFEALAEKFRHKEKEQFRLSLLSYSNGNDGTSTVKELASKYGAVYHSNTFYGSQVDIKSYKEFVIKNRIPRSRMAIKGWDMPNKNSWSE